MVRRKRLEKAVRNALKRAPVVSLLGPRQCGKTTLARVIARGSQGDYFDLENPVDQERLRLPMLTLEALRGLVVIDEIQQRPELLELLRVLADRRPIRARFLILGSASPYLVKQSAESLAGRVEFIDMHGFDLQDVGPRAATALWLRGGLPLSFLAQSDAGSLAWRKSFVRTFLERDLPQLGITTAAATLRRFWTMLAHYHGQLWNAAEFARSLGASEPTARRYLDILTGALVVRQLPPWFENMAKRQVKSPKVYLRDTGVLHALLDLRTRRHLMQHPKVGASWEGFVIEQILSLSRDSDAYFWSTYQGAELDLLLRRGGRTLGFEVKMADAPTLTKSMRLAVDELHLSRLWTVYPGTRSYRLASNVDVIPVRELPRILES